MPNMGSLVSRHNTKLLMDDNPVQGPGCNCQGGPTNCPPPTPECQKDNVIYVASVAAQNRVNRWNFQKQMALAQQ